MKNKKTMLQYLCNSHFTLGISSLILSISLSTHAQSSTYSNEARISISATVPSVCSIKQQMGSAKGNKLTMKLFRHCNAGHSVHLSASLDDEPVDGLILKLGGEKIKGSEGEWTLYTRAPPSISQDTLIIEMPKKLKDVSGISFNLTIEADS